MTDSDDTFGWRSDPAKWEAVGRLERQFEASIGEHSATSAHVEIKPRFKESVDGRFGYVQVIKDVDIEQIVKDVNTLGNVHTLDLTENRLVTDAAVKHLKKLKGVLQLWLTGTKITEDGFDTIVEALSQANVVHDSLDEDDEVDDDDD